MFQASQLPQTRCDVVLASSDERLEDNEEILLTLQSMDLDVVVGSAAVASVVILDNSSE